MDQEWTPAPTQPYYLAPDMSDIRYLKVMSVDYGQRKMQAYHDETPIKYTLRWVHPETLQEKDFNWEEVPNIVRDKILDKILCKRNPWSGCHWSDSFVKAEADYVIKNENIPIGD